MNLLLEWLATRSPKGAKWWTRLQPIRTLSEIPLEFSIPLDKPSILQVISEAASKLRDQGFSFRKIAKLLLVDEKTVRTAINRGKKLLSVLLLKL